MKRTEKKTFSHKTRGSPRVRVILLFCLLVASTLSTATAGMMHNTIKEYDGAGTCIVCHQQEGEDFVTSIHNTWLGTAEYIDGKNGTQTGKLIGINDFCISVESNEALCGNCHAGYGLLENDFSIEQIDCLICHAPDYKKTASGPDPSINATDAARNVGQPTREMCLRCHATASGGDNNKRGDLELAMGELNISEDLDIHMNAGMTCLDCHTFIDHHVSGRGMDLRVDDTDVMVSCDDEKCHGTMPHANGSTYNQHTDRIYCTTCHITAYGKVQTAEISRDWEHRTPNDDNALQTKMYTPTFVRESNPAPTQVWWNRRSEIMDLADPVVFDSDGVVVMAKPAGGIDDPASKIYASRIHLGRQPWDGTYLLPFRTMTVLMSDNMTQALFESTGKIYDPIQYVDAKRYMGIFHGVSPKDEALICEDCHEDHMIDFEALGYEVEKDTSGSLIKATKPGESLNLADLSPANNLKEDTETQSTSTPGFGIVSALCGFLAIICLQLRRK
ncbi:Cytochrome c [Candidatus Methanomarinus sp.]|nr:Cytochrome c [ANME-2 cluster archaeon]